MLRIKRRRGTNSTFIFIKLLTVQAKISFLRQRSFQYFHFTEYKTKYFRDEVIPILSFYRIQNQKVHISCLHLGTSSNFPFINCRHIDQKLIFATWVNPILPFHQIQNQIRSHIMFATRKIKGQVQISHLSNLQAYRPKQLFRDQVIPILSFYRIQNQIISRQGHSYTYTEYKIKQAHISCFTSRDKFKLPIYQTSNHIRLSKSNLKPNRFKDDATHQGISKDNFELSNTFILQNTKPNSFETRSFQYFHFTEYKIKQAYISCFASRDKFKHLI